MSKKSHERMLAENEAKAVARMLSDGAIVIVLSNAGQHKGTTWASYLAQRLATRK